MDTQQNMGGDKDKAPTQPASRSEDEGPSPQEMEESVRIAFNQPLLLEMILDYSMREENGVLSPDNIQNLRLVGKSWTEAVSKKLHQNKEPLFRLKLDTNNSLLRSSIVKNNGKLLDQFVDYWTAENRVVPTFKIQLDQEYFRQENYNSLLDCLRKCGDGLVEIELFVPENCGSLPGILPNVTLPILQKMTINFTGQTLGDRREDESVGHSSNVTFLFQSLLTRNESLRKLVITSGNWEKVPSFPGAQYATLPSTLTSLVIDFRGAETILEILTRNHLPRIKSLTLAISCGTPVSSNLLFKIFENVRKTLRRLELFGQNYTGPPRVPNLLNFPVMEQLETLEIHKVYFELEREIPSMEELFPQLENLVLYDQTPQMLQKWTTGAPFGVLLDLILELVDESMPEHECNTLPLTVEAIQGAHQRFTNVSSLGLLINGREISGLKYVFLEMGQLRKLRINVVGIESSVTSDHWDSLLIGAPVGFVVGMATCPQFWSQVELKNGNEPSIRNLIGLRTFKLKEIDADKEEDVDNRPKRSLISNLSFVYGFLKMSYLAHLEFKGNFRASEEMASEWKKLGGTITYSK